MTGSRISFFVWAIKWCLLAWGRTKSSFSDLWTVRYLRNCSKVCEVGSQRRIRGCLLLWFLGHLLTYPSFHFISSHILSSAFFPSHLTDSAWLIILPARFILHLCENDICFFIFNSVRLFGIPWTVAHQAPLSMGFSRQGHWSGLPFPSPGDLPYPGIEPRSPTLEADALTSEPPGKPIPS